MISHPRRSQKRRQTLKEKRSYLRMIKRILFYARSCLLSLTSHIPHDINLLHVWGVIRYRLIHAAAAAASTTSNAIRLIQEEKSPIQAEEKREGRQDSTAAAGCMDMSSSSSSAPPGGRKMMVFPPPFPHSRQQFLHTVLPGGVSWRQSAMI